MSKRALIDDLYAEYGAIPVLQELAAGRQMVKGAGPLDAPLAVVGEAPGEDEVKAGEPFTGPSGQLLQDWFKQAGIPWELCYRMNVVPWRPPGNRTPYPFEVFASWSRVAGEIEVVSPHVVIAVGATAWAGITRRSHGKFAEGRYKWLQAQDSGLTFDLLAIHHPGYVLRLDDATRQFAEETIIRKLRTVFPDTEDER